MKTGTLLRGTAALIILTAVTPGLAVPVAIDTTNASNGITDLYSATFDPPLEACTGSDPSYCAFFLGTPGPTREIVVTPTPTGVANLVPLGITPVPASGSFLDLTLNAGKTQLTLAGGTVAFPPLTLTIQGTSPTPTAVNASGAGIVFKTSPQTVAINAAGQAEFLVAPVPIGTAVDFSTFSIIVGPPNGSCAGPQCALIPILTLDAVRFRLFIDYDPTFTTFTASYIGQTQNNSLLYITLNSGAPEIGVSDSVLPATDLKVPFGDVTELTSATPQTVTVTNSGQANLLLGAIGLANPLTPFALANDTCTGATVLPAASCTVDVTFSPGSVGTFTDSLNIPSNDADEPSITVEVSGNGTAQPVPNISVTDSVTPTTDGLVPFGSAGTGTQLNQTVTVTNDGNADLVLFSVGVANALAPPFSLVNDNCSDQTVAPTASCTIGVRFEPTAAGTFSGTFDIPSNDTADPTVLVSVSGTGTVAAVPDISVTDDTLPGDDLLVPFGNITEGTTRDLTVTVTNVGGADLVLGTIAGTNPLAEPFSLGTNSCSGQTLAPTASCTFITRYAPAGTGAASDNFNIPSNDTDEPSVLVSVTGTGITLGQGGVGTPKPSGASSGFMAMDPATLLLLSAAGAWGWRRRRAQ